MVYKFIKIEWKIIVSVVLMVSTTHSQTNDQIKLVLELNREIRAAENAYLEAREKIKVAGVLPDPILESSFSINSIETRNGPVEAQFMLGQKFPMWGKLKRERNIQRIKAEISRLNWENIEVKVSFLLRKQLAENYKITQSLNILKQYQTELESFKSIAQSQYANGIGLTQHPIIKLQIEESLVESKINELESAFDKNANDLQVLFDGQFLIDMVNIDFELPQDFKSDQYWIEIAKNVNPKFAQSQAMVAVASDQYKLSKLKNYPDLMAGLTYSIVGPTDLSGAVSSGQDAVGVKLGINIPLWFGRNKARVKSASLNVQQQEELLIDAWNKIEADISSTLSELHNNIDTYRIYEESIIYESEQMLSSAYAAYETGKISFLDLLDSVRLDVKVKLEFENIKAKQATLIAKLYKSTGIVEPIQESNHEN